jgi:hypothetical protein
MIPKEDAQSSDGFDIPRWPAFEIRLFRVGANNGSDPLLLHGIRDITSKVNKDMKNVNTL